MGRIKIDLPKEFSFTCKIPLRITDINYGGHAGNDSVLGIIHEARMQYLKNFDLSELKFDGVGLIMTDVAIEFKSELFYGDTIIASVQADEFSDIGFAIFYKLEKKTTEGNKVAAIARTGMLCYNYEKKKIAKIPGEAKDQLSTD
ncbi:MAG TPA: thioesterase family protein [Chitinophagaceae bacterium]|nr:thioesterase family protein [Chitinophagaceae bacterium]MCB9056880.1 thioesterase family protein [Chitinophagales bacterium]HPG11224.1 thioesterase family protein [Chitinophagaceae bacterium]